jgi:hypothetical protein
MPCPRCQQENRPGAKFCDECKVGVGSTFTFMIPVRRGD